MAKKYHPDTNKDKGAKDRFSDAQSAYEILSDRKKKEAWDQYGAAAFDQGSGFDPATGATGGRGPVGAQGGFGGFSGAGFGGGGATGFGADINFEDLFGAFTGGGRRARGSRQSPFQQEEIMVGQNIEVQTNITFMDAAKGTNKDIFITPLFKCKTCSGGGLKEGFRRAECKKCDGSGTRVHFVQAGFQMASTCDTCGGSGIVVPRGGECNTCSGQGVVRQRKTVNVDIPPGVEDGMRLRVSGEGDAPATGMTTNPSGQNANGDLYVFIHVAADSKFSRSGADVLYTASIPITTATLGGEINVPTLDGEVKLKVGTGTATGDKVILSGMGMPRIGGRPNAAGDLRVEFKVAMPKYLSANQRVILEMLADELGDDKAKRTMTAASRGYVQYSKLAMNLTNDRSANTNADTSKPNSEAGTERHGGFLKAAWQKLTHQDESLAESRLQEAKEDEKTAENEPKKASG